MTDYTALAAELDATDADLRARLTAPDALANAARWYATHGIPVFPLLPRRKTPATAHGFHDATLDPDQIRAWWTMNPHYNVGMPTGSVADVIDIDGPAGILSLAGNNNNPDLITALRAGAIGIVSTPRPGGMHYYLPPSRRRNTARKLMAGADTRGAGGYVVLPPSVTDEHGPGRRYTWIRPLVTT